MNKSLIFLFCMLFSGVAHAEFEKMRTVTDPQFGPLRQAEALDVSLDLEYGRVSGRGIGILNARLGYLHVREPLFISGGPAIRLSTGLSTALGPQLQIEHLWMGMWGQGAVLVDTHGKIIGTIGAGFSIIGAEIQLNNRGNMDIQVFFKLRLPVGVLLLWACNQ